MTKTIEFETELTGGSILSIPPEVAEALPPSGKATVVVFVDMDPDDTAWQQAAYEQFLIDELVETNPEFRALVAKSKASPRKPFSPGDRGPAND
jgi:hypothetical protein